MKGVVFWFSLFSPEKKKKNDLKLFPKVFYFIRLSQMQQMNCGWIDFQLPNQISTQYLVYFHHVLIPPLSLFQKPPQLSAQHGGNAPWLLQLQDH